MKKSNNLKLILFFAILTIAVTSIVILTWEKLLMHPFYGWIAQLYPGDESQRYYIEQRIEHFFISTTVDVIVVTLLLRIVSRQQHRLSASEERYRALFEHAITGIAVITASTHHLVEVNHKFCEIVGRQSSELLGKDVRELVWGDSKNLVKETLPRLLAGHLSNEGELTLKTAAGVALPVMASSSTLATDEEQLVILIIHDVSARKRLEAEKDEIQRQLFQSSKLASIGELSAGVAHEINNPLNGIINFAQLLKDEQVARTPDHERMLDGIIEEGERITKIVRDLLIFARQDTPQLARVNIAETIRTSMSLFGHRLDKDGITVVLEVADNLPPVWADGSRLRQVMVNMISNAHHALKTKGSGLKLLQIRARNVVRQGQSIVRVEFHDSGTGIRQEHLEKVFDPFFTTKRDHGGTGLGLSLSFGIVRDYGGTIMVESEEGRYTRFAIEFPASAAWDEAGYSKSFAHAS